ncbi:MAG: GAF domain-containing protein [Oscillospiraceae bacterium]|nr:GAF domain-containing protein [Oscillospiraceae bacterium]
MDIEQKTFDTKPELYSYIHEQLRLICAETSDETAVLANASGLLMLELDEVNWAGFYLFKNGKLILGPFQGKPAVAEIEIGAGVCGTAAQTHETQIVEDVHTCCNHITCDFATNSEIVVPILANGELYGVIDIDSPVNSRFDSEDAKELEEVANIISDFITK